MTLLPWLLLVAAEMNAAPITITHGQMQFSRFGSYFGTSLELYGNGLEIKGAAYFANAPGDGCYESSNLPCPDGTVTSPSFYGTLDSSHGDSVMVNGVTYYRSSPYPVLFGTMHLFAQAGGAAVAESVEAPFTTRDWRLWIQDTSRDLNPRDVDLRLDLTGSGFVTSIYRRYESDAFPQGHTWTWTSSTFTFATLASDEVPVTAAPEPATALAGVLALAVLLIRASVRGGPTAPAPSAAAQRSAPE
ncbi:MAG: hypothetical protein JNK87_12580 [Bryobacterales bacterium]|nr:hypothetical protein [Bryobacterales bacterium]